MNNYEMKNEIMKRVEILDGKREKRKKIIYSSASLAACITIVMCAVTLLPERKKHSRHCSGF